MFDPARFPEGLKERLEPGLEALVGMTFPNERRLARFFAREAFSGHGEIVDLGSWWGASAAAAADGLDARGAGVPSSVKVHAYDNFLWAAWMDEVYPSLAGRHKPGESFLEDFQKAISPWSKRIEVHAEDLAATRWTGGPVEYLFVDAMKSWELARAIAGEFFTRMIPGRGFIVHQDFKHYGTPWIHLLMYRLRRQCRFVYNVPEACSVVFQVTEPLDAAACEHATAFSTFTLGEIGRAFEYSASLCAEQERSEVLAAKVMLFIYWAKDEIWRRNLSPEAIGSSVGPYLKI